MAITSDDDSGRGFEQARFKIAMGLSNSDPTLLHNAQKAIRQEYRDASKWKRLQCRGAQKISEDEAGSIYQLNVAHAIEFDWTWEGAYAFRPASMAELTSSSTLYDAVVTDPEVDESVVWAGDVIEVDETNDHIFLLVSNPEHPPCAGSFYVCPFEFLAITDAIYNEPRFEDIRHVLESRLPACQGSVHPKTANPAKDGLPSLSTWWSHSWSILWGPPGTGKTYTTGQQVAHVLPDTSERVLVVSTTNQATDEVALSIGAAAKQLDLGPVHAPIIRIGKGARVSRFKEKQLDHMLNGTETEALERIDILLQELARTSNSEEKARLRKQIQELREGMLDRSKQIFLDSAIRTVVSTSFKATALIACEEVRSELERGFAPFTTIFIDEAGLLSRIAVAALSLLASRRVVLVGDSKQLAPISRISRILAPNQGTWLGRSALSHLHSVQTETEAIHILLEQRRMATDICKVISQYQYEGTLRTADDRDSRGFSTPKSLEGMPRAMWFVLDECGLPLPTLRAERGPGNRSWIRRASESVMSRILSDPAIRELTGLYISPFRAQATMMQRALAAKSLQSWRASTVHSQQGSESDVVIFDTVNAGSYGWPYDEWKRLVNVALSRAREFVVVIASRAEMQEPYLRPLATLLTPITILKEDKRHIWKRVHLRNGFVVPETIRVDTTKQDDQRIGRQLELRKQMRPVLSQEQQRLCGLELDGKPRLVRGVAGSGKTLVLANWLTKVMEESVDRPESRIWAVFANRTLQTLIGDSIDSAWAELHEGRAFPWDRVDLQHIRDVLDALLPEVGLRMNHFQFDYDGAAAAYLRERDSSNSSPRCDAMFIDEAQDMGPNALQMLASLVRQTDPEDPNSRAINIFYDNAQNIYGRDTPRWSELGLDMRGRSTVMKESFRSTLPITEYALNVLYKLQPPDDSPDHQELVSRSLIEKTARHGSTWWRVRFNQVNGPKPEFHLYTSRDNEMQGIGKLCRRLIVDEAVDPNDICILYNGKRTQNVLTRRVQPMLNDLGVEISVQTSKSFERSSSTILATTPHSFKGYESEIVILAGADQFVAQKEAKVLANNLYVAMTRARSMLEIFAHEDSSEPSKRICEVLEACLNQLEEQPDVDLEISPQEDFEDVVRAVGTKNRVWLRDIWDKYEIVQEPLLSSSGEIIAEPVFRFEVKGISFACFNQPPSRRIQRKLEELGVRAFAPGDDVVDRIGTSR